MDAELLAQLLTWWVLISALPFPGKWSSRAYYAWVIPAIAAVVGAVGSWMKNRAAGKSVAEQQALYNAYLAARAAGVKDIIANLAARGTDVFGPQVNTREGTASQQSTTQQSATPTITAAYAPLEAKLREIIGGRLALETAPVAGAAEQKARYINQTFAAALSNERNRTARTGVKPLVSDVNSRRAGALADVLPDVERERRGRQTEDIGLASALAQAFGRGMDSTGSTVGSGSSTDMYTSPPNFSALMALLLPPGPQAGAQTGVSTLGGGIGDAAAIFAQLYKPKGEGG